MPRHEVPPAPPNPPPEAPPGALLPGVRLAEFEIERVLGVGGFGIVYLAFDHVLHRRVAIKEYMPAALAARARDATVTVHSGAQAATFAAGLQSFINEGRLLARFDHPALVKVHRFWEANGTAYMVMPWYAGRALNEISADMAQPPDEVWLRRLIDPLLEALELLHRDGVYHRDISPDNILLLPDGSPVLLDFGSARKVIGDRTQMLTAVLKPKFAPVEQYADVPGMRQGPWTDLYALGAVVRYLLSREAPMPAVMRAVRDTMCPLSQGAAPAGVSGRFLTVIDWTMSVEPEGRPQDVAALRDALDGRREPPLAWQPHPVAEAPPPAAETPAAPSQAWPATVSMTQPVPQPMPQVPVVQRRAWSPRLALLGGAAVAIGAALGVWLFAAQPPAAAQAAEVVAAPALARVAPTPHAPAEEPAEEPVERSTDRRNDGQRPTAAAATTDTRRSTATPKRPSPAEPRRTVAADPERECGDRNFISRGICLYNACLEPRFRAHAACVKLREEQEARRRAEMYR